MDSFACNLQSDEIAEYQPTSHDMMSLAEMSREDRAADLYVRLMTRNRRSGGTYLRSHFRMCLFLQSAKRPKWVDNWYKNQDYIGRNIFSQFD